MSTDWKTLGKIVLVDGAKSVVAVGASRAINLRDKVQFGDSYPLIIGAEGTINYVTSEAIDYFAYGKTPDVLTGDYERAINRILYFSGAVAGANLVRADETFVNTYRSMGLTRDNAEFLTDATILTGSRIGYKIIEATNPNSVFIKPTSLIM